MDFKHMNIRMKDPNSERSQSKPPLFFGEMKEAAQIILKNMSHVRLDFYEANKSFFLEELTLYHCSGFASSSKEYDREYGKTLFVDNIFFL